MIEMDEAEGIVTSIKTSGRDLLCNVLSSRAVQAKSPIDVKLYDTVKVSDGVVQSVLGKGSASGYDAAIQRLLAIPRKHPSEEGSKRYSKILSRMESQLSEAARMLSRAFASGAPIVVRFHNDGDGSAGAVAIYRALSKLQGSAFENGRQVSWQMNRSIAYTIESFYSDRMLFQSYESIEKPVLLITDFGTSPESAEAIRAASGACNIIWLDHHPPYEGFPRELAAHYINVCDFGGESDFTAGLLACIFAERLADVDVEDMKGAALVSDYSKYADFNDANAVKNSIILDCLTSSADELDSKPSRIDRIVTDRELSDSTFRSASGKLEAALEEGVRNIRAYRANGIPVYLLDFSHIAKLRLDYPLPGRYASKLQEHMESKSGGDAVTLVHYGNFVSVRMSRGLCDSIDIHRIIEKMKKESASGSISGGGHKQAASIRSDRESISSLISMLLKELGVSEEYSP